MKFLKDFVKSINFDIDYILLIVNIYRKRLQDFYESLISS